MALIDDVLAVIIDGTMLGPVLSFTAQLRLSRTSRSCYKLYRAVWQLMWQARAERVWGQRASMSSIAHSRPLIREMRTVLRRAVEAAKADHVLALVVNTTTNSGFHMYRPLVDGQSFLHLAVRLLCSRFSKQRSAIVKHLIHAGGRSLVCQPLITVRDDDREANATALHLCAGSRCVEVIDALVAAGGRQLLMARTGLGDTCLHFSVTTGSSAVIAALITHGGHRLLISRDHAGRTCLIKAIESGRLNLVKTLLLAAETYRPEPNSLRLISMCDYMGSSCLFVAAQHGRLAIAEELIEQGGKELIMKTLTETGTSCLHAAVVNNHLDLVICLLAHGGRELALMSTNIGLTALHLAAHKRSRAMVEALIACAGIELLMMRVTDGVGQNRGTTCLHIAAAEDAGDVAMLLLESGGTELLFARDSSGRTALFLAVGSGNNDLVTHFLYAGGPDLLAIEKKDGTSCLELACRRGNIEVATTLVAFSLEFMKTPERRLSTKASNALQQQMKLGILAAKYQGHKKIAHWLAKVLEGKERPPLPSCPPPFKSQQSPVWLSNLKNKCCIS